MSDHLHVFTLRTANDVRHTHLTRAEGQAPALPPLTDWLGAEVDPDEIEMFPVGDLGEMRLTEYLTLAFAPEAIAPRDARRIDAIKPAMTVLLVPERALSEEPAPTADVTLIATLPLARADHAGTLPKADLTPAPPPQRPRPEPARGNLRRRQALKVGAFIVVFVLLYIVLER